MFPIDGHVESFPSHPQSCSKRRALYEREPILCITTCTRHFAGPNYRRNIVPKFSHVPDNLTITRFHIIHCMKERPT